MGVEHGLPGHRRRGRVIVSLVVGVALLGAVACAPYFGEGATLTATPIGQLVRLSWTAAQADGEGETVAEYGIEVNGTEVARYPAPGTSCVLTGLAGGTGYTLSVTVYGANGEHSATYGAPLESSARVSTAIVTPSSGAPAGSNPVCVAPTDSDGDRIPNALETNTGVFVSAAATGTNPNSADTDADGIRDGDEVFGTTSGLDLHTMGTRPVKKDLLFEFDWFDDNADPQVCGAHSHRPTLAMVNRVGAAFATTPVGNPDGTLGINVIGDYGQGGPFTGGNLVPDADGVIDGGINGSQFQAIKAGHFDPRREGLFHYTLMPHRYNTTSDSSGQAELPGDDLIVSLQCYSSTNNTANTIMHEVGHNLNLRHGGNVNTNSKPNYNSVMNYRFQFPGVDTNCNLTGDGVLAYSNGSRASLNEATLFETAGICNGVDIDWNLNGSIQPSSVSFDINRDGAGNGDGLLQVLTDYNDAANLCLTCIADADGAPVGTNRTDQLPELISDQPVPLSAR